MKKMLIWVTTFPEFSETFIRDHICGLIDRDYDVTIFAGSIDKANQSALNGFERYDLMKKTITFQDIVPRSKVRRLLALITILTGSLVNGSAAPLLRSLNVLSLGIKALTLNTFFLTHYVMSRKIGVVHAHYGPNGIEAVDIKQVIPTIKLITTFHGYDIRLGYQEGGHIYEKLFNSVDTLIAISEYNFQCLLALGAPREKIVIVPNGIILKRLLAIKRSHCTDSQLISILSVGRLVKEKGYKLILKAIQLIKETYTDNQFEYHIIGEGEQRGEIEYLVKCLDLAGQVTLHGKKSSQEVCEMMAQSDLYLMGSVEEALPTVVIEAQAAGLPVIATNVGSIRNMIDNYRTGIIVEPNDPIELKRGIAYMLDHKESWAEMGSHGRRFAKETYSIEKCIAKLEAVYLAPDVA